MAFIEARPGPPPGAPIVLAQPCPDARAYLTLRVCNFHAIGSPPLANTELEVSVGAVQARLSTDANGLVTFVYHVAADFAAQAIAVTLTDANRAWVGAAATEAAVMVPVVVAGKFRLSATIHVIKPGADEEDVPWCHAWTENLALTVSSMAPGAAAVAEEVSFEADEQDPPADHIEEHELDCVSAHVLHVRLFGALDTSTVDIAIDAAASTPVTVADTVASNVTSRQSGADNGVRLSCTRHGAAVSIKFVFHFRQVLIVGEGTGFQYALGLAEKYGNALADPDGFRWVVATQYDVTDPGGLPVDVAALHWDSGVVREHANLRQDVADVMDRNLINHAQQFDATIAGHWQAVGERYGEFDGVVFNNPHPGYGMHMCEVLGLVSAGPHAAKNGRAISVFSFGFGRQLSAPENLHFRSLKHRGYYSTQRLFVRGNAANKLNHQNVIATNVALQRSAADTAPMALQVSTAFVHASDNSAIGATYGTVGGIAANATDHFCSTVATIGLQGYLLRSYRLHGPSVLKSGGRLMVNGSNAWNDMLTAGFMFRADAGDIDVPAMANGGGWVADGEYFAHYQSNLTSELIHPSWYSDLGFRAREPNIANAVVFQWTKP